VRKVDIAILGGGVAGLGFYSGCESGIIFEKDGRPGGHIKSRRIENYYFDQGAHICHSKNGEWLNLLISNSLSINEKKSAVRNLKKDLVFEYPVQNNLFRQNINLRSQVLKELWSISSQSSELSNYEDWLVAQYGKTLFNEFYKLYTLKYWRTEASEMGLGWLKGRLINVDKDNIIAGLFEKPQVSQAVFNTFKYPKEGGFESFFSHLYDDIPIEVNHEVTSIDTENKIVYFLDKDPIQYSRLISSLPLTDLVRKIHPLREELISISEKLKYLNLIQINLVLNQTSVPLLSDSDWFYIYDQDVDISRVSLLNNVSGSDGKTIIQAEIFRRNDESRDVQKLVDKGVKDLLKIFRSDSEDIVLAAHSLIEYTYPVPLKNTDKEVNRLKDELRQLGIHTIGVYGNWDYTFSDLTYQNAYNYGKSFL
jgi:protoporphyrinogen oxidase